MHSDKEILCIHYYFPPIRSGGVLRNYFFACEFAKYFKHVHVITTSNVDHMDQEIVELPSNISIYKAQTNDFRSVIKEKNHFSMSSKNSKWFQFLSKLKKTLPFHFYIDEGGQKYIRSASKIGHSLLSKNNISHIYSSFMPYADHKIASYLKKGFPNLKWIADFRDLQNEPIYKNILFPKWNDSIERKILKSANYLSTVSEGLANSLRKLHTNVISIPRGISYDLKHIPESSIFTIAYTGSLFYDFRDGSLFVKAVKQWVTAQNIQPSEFIFRYAGRDGKKWQKWFEELEVSAYFKDLGFISRKKSLELQRNANALLMLSSSSPEQQGVFTGKLFEYLEGNSPIINIINGVKDQEFESFFEETEAGRIFYNNEINQLAEYLNELYLNFGTNPTISSRAQKRRFAMTWTHRAKQLLDGDQA